MRYHALCVLYIVLVLAGCSQTFSLSPTPSLSQISNEYGFQRFQGTQTSLEPGTLITLEQSGEGLAEITPVCWRHQAFPALPPARPVSGAESDLKRQLGDWHDFEPAYLKNLQAKFPEVEEIQLRLRNASVVENSAMELYQGLSARSQACQEVVAAREAKGETVYTILKVLRADVTYNVIGVDRSRIIGKFPQKVLAKLKTELGGSSVSTFNQTIKGSGLQLAFQADIIGTGLESLTEPKDTEISDSKSEEFSRIARLTKAQRKSIIQKTAILMTKTSDADEYQK